MADALIRILGEYTVEYNSLIKEELLKIGSMTVATKDEKGRMHICSTFKAENDGVSDTHLRAYLIFKNTSYRAIFEELHSLKVANRKRR